MYRSEKLLALFFVVISAFIFVGSLYIRGRTGIAGPVFFPRFWAGALALLSVVYFLQTLAKEKKEAAGTEAQAPEKKPLAGYWENQKYVIFTITATLLYILFLRTLGYIVSTFILMAFTIYILGAVRKYRKNIALLFSLGMSVLITVGTYLLFSELLNVFLPAGIFRF